MYLGAVLSVSAKVELIVVWMVLLLLPTVAVEALELILAPILVTANELSGPPIDALLL